MDQANLSKQMYLYEMDLFGSLGYTVIYLSFGGILTKLEFHLKYEDFQLIM